MLVKKILAEMLMFNYSDKMLGESHTVIMHTSAPEEHMPFSLEAHINA